MVLGKLGGGFQGVGAVGAGIVAGGAFVNALMHGVIAKKLADHLITTGTPADVAGNKADMMVSGIMAIPIGTFAVLRFTKYTYESDVIDAIGCYLLGTGIYEVGNAAEIIGGMLNLEGF